MVNNAMLKKNKEQELQAEFYSIIADIAEHETVLKMKQYRQHYDTSTYEHCMHVAFLNYKIGKKLNLDSLLYQKIGQLSTGQTQRVNIARCFIHDPKYYVFDEATTGLDIISSQIILDFMKEEKKKGKTILYSTHYMEEAENICDRVIMIHEGEVLLSGTPEEIKKNTKTTNLRDAFFALIGGEIDEK